MQSPPPPGGGGCGVGVPDDSAPPSAAPSTADRQPPPTLLGRGAAWFRDLITGLIVTARPPTPDRNNTRCVLAMLGLGAPPPPPRSRAADDGDGAVAAGELSLDAADVFLGAPSRGAPPPPLGLVPLGLDEKCAPQLLPVSGGYVVAVRACCVIGILSCPLALDERSARVVLFSWWFSFVAS